MPVKGHPDAMSDTTQVDATSTATENQDSDLDQIKGLGDDGKEALRKEREARKEEAKARKAAEAELTTLRKAAADAEAAKAAEAEEDAKRKGEFEKLANDRAESLKAVTTERDALTEQIATYQALIAPIVTERLDALKAANADVAKGFPVDADLLTQLAYLDDPRTKALIDAQAAKADTLRQWPGTPKPNTNLDPTDDDAKRSQGRMYRDF